MQICKNIIKECFTFSITSITKFCLWSHHVSTQSSYPIMVLLVKWPCFSIFGGITTDDMQSHLIYTSLHKCCNWKNISCCTAVIISALYTFIVLLCHDPGKRYLLALLWCGWCCWRLLEMAGNPWQYMVPPYPVVALYEYVNLCINCVAIGIKVLQDPWFPILECTHFILYYAYSSTKWSDANLVLHPLTPLSHNLSNASPFILCSSLPE